MKSWILAVMFVLLPMFAMSCVSSDDPVEDEQGEIADDVELSSTSSELTYSCGTTCYNEYTQCKNGDPFNDCLCYNDYQLCRRACGLSSAPLRQCYP